MKKGEASLHKLHSLTDFHRMFGLPAPRHPLVSFINIADMRYEPGALPSSLIMDFYKVAYKNNLCGRAKYGQDYYDFGEGGLVYTSPGQVFESPVGSPTEGYMLLFHPDLLLSYQLANTIRSFGYFSYAANEALHVSEQEKKIIMKVFDIIDEELNGRIDDFSQDVIISQIELLLNYSNRFYKRQFITRKAVVNEQLLKIEQIIDAYLNDDKAVSQGLPSVQYLADQVNLSPGYLSDMLRTLTGQNAQQLIQHKLIEKAKELLSTTERSVAEIAYQLGFEHPQSFTRLFSNKVKMSPVVFRHSFN
ncbi:helix-turn-helix domain-containing protein [Mucilaginibacter sp. KACC 22063]|uniref:helix-turn-helix domain-containing protein n=1 Tax=Mucilaginibacter sp. KACC 22063 TaxID=3025666 RepID=UPI00236623BB|nr:AraC family transcriptional regulator [Mucilaginibacter sp. KACC 22063]WDF54248.1 AraC family transcriptional regulator [Mucilaginibacter sp. KACC 22063]